MRKLIFILLLPVLIFAQSENQSQSIELPDFVITGKQKVDLPIMKKAKADPVSILSKEYFFPSFTPEQFSLATVARPSQQIADLSIDEKAYNKQLILGAGLYTLPTGKFYFSQPFSVGKFYSKLWGTNQRDYVDYADHNVSGINVGSKFYIDRNGEFLPGAILTIDGNFVRKDYNFYSPLRPINITPVKRETQNIFGSLSLENYYGKYFQYKFTVGANNIDIKDADTKETNLKFSADTKTQFGSFAILLGGDYQQQNISRNFGDDNYSYYNFKGGVQFRLSDALFLRGGVGYYSADTKDWLQYSNYAAFEDITKDLISPWGEIEYIFNSYLSLSASYKPKIDFKTYSDCIDINPYIHIRQTPYVTNYVLDNNVTIYNHKIDVALTYGYKKYYEVVFGGEFYKSDDFIFFNSNFSFDNSPGHSYSFKLEKLYNVTGYSIYANALYHLGPFGWFYADAKYQVVKSDDNWTNKEVTIPYQPKLSIEAAYGYEFGFGFSAEFKLRYLKDTYADIENNILLDDYINLSAKLRYSLTKSFDFTVHLNNLLNRDNYIWLVYIEPPFDITAGIDFRF